MKRLRHLSPDPPSPAAASSAANGVEFRFPAEHNAYSRAVLEELQDAKKARAFERLRASIADIWRPEFEDDFYLFRWVKARQFDAKKAEQMLRAHMEWRGTFGADTILEDFQMPAVLAEYYTGGFCGSDNEGRPVWFDPIGRSDPEGLARSASRDELIRSRIYISEWTWRRLLPRRRAETGRAVYQLTVVYDMADFGRRQMWPPSLDLFLELTRICEANYPETMGLAFVINAPALFPALFNMLRPLLHKETQNKIHVLGDNYQEVLRQYIPPDQLPACYGGEKRDPDGSPQCSTWICYGGQVPPDYFLRPEHAGRMEQAVVGRRAAHKVELTVQAAQLPASIAWEFVTEDGDIGFEVYQQPANGDQQKRYLVQCGRVESDLRPFSGRIACPAAGCYTVKFDNGHSWTRAKRLSYYLEVSAAAAAAVTAAGAGAAAGGTQTTTTKVPFRNGVGGSRLRFIPASDVPSLSVPATNASNSSCSALTASFPTNGNGGGLVGSPSNAGSGGGGGGLARQGSQESFHTACSQLSDSAVTS